MNLDVCAMANQQLQFGVTNSAIQNYVQQPDKDSILQFPARLTELQDGQASGQHYISSYEVMAREHGKLIIPQISEMMRNVLKVLSSDAPSLALQQTCVKVVSALARYAIEPSSTEREREGVIRDLANPLLEVLIGNVQSLAEGAAMCLQALLNTEIWKFAPDQIVNEVCLRVAAALQEKETQTTEHMKLVCSLVEHNNFILEAYGTSLLRAAHDIIYTANSQLRLNAVQMINALLKNINAYMLDTEIPFTITNLERCMSDRIPSIRDAALETLQIAKEIASEGGMDVSYESLSSEVGTSNEDVTSRKSIGSGICDFSQRKYFRSYTDPLAALLHSFNTERRTPSVLGSAVGSTGSCGLYGSQGYHSDVTDETSFSGKIRDSTFSMHPEMSNSKTPTNATDMAIEQTRYSFLNHKGKDMESGGYFNQKSQLENDMVYESDAEVVADCEVDYATSGRNYSCRDMNTRLYMFQQKGNGDESTYEKDCIENKHSWINYTQSPPHSDVTEEKDTGRPKKADSMARTDYMKLKQFSPPRAYVGSLQRHSLPQVTRRKSQSKSKFSDFTYGNYDKHDSLRREKTGQMTAALKGRAPLDKVESLADGFSDKNNSQEGSIENSSARSESVQISDYLSSTSSSTLYQDVSENEEDYSTALPTEPDKKNCQSAESDSSEGSVDFPVFEKKSAFRRGWTKVMYFMKSMLEGSLCAVLAVPVAMIAVQLLSTKEEYHVIVPT